MCLIEIWIHLNVYSFLENLIHFIQNILVESYMYELQVCVPQQKIWQLAS